MYTYIHTDADDAIVAVVTHQRRLCIVIRRYQPTHADWTCPLPPKNRFYKKRFGYSGGLIWGRRGKTGGGAEKLRHREPKRTASKFALPNTDWWDFMIERLT